MFAKRTIVLLLVILVVPSTAEANPLLLLRVLVGVGARRAAVAGGTRAVASRSAAASVGGVAGRRAASRSVGQGTSTSGPSVRNAPHARGWGATGEAAAGEVTGTYRARVYYGQGRPRERRGRYDRRGERPVESEEREFSVRYKPGFPAAQAAGAAFDAAGRSAAWDHSTPTVLAGTWKGGGHEYSCTIHLSYSGQICRGTIEWTRVAAPPGSVYQRNIGRRATEYVDGKYDPRTRTLDLTGYAIAPSDFLATDSYRFWLSADMQGFAGLAAGASGRWQCRVEGQVLEVE